MSTVKSKKLQVGTDASASNNFTIYQPATPDGTLRIGVGNADSPTEVGRFTSAGYKPATAPMFSAYVASNQSISSSTNVKVPINTEEFDTNSNYDHTTNYRFTPTVAGYYQINASVATVGGATRAFAMIFKNGAEFKRGNDCAAAVNQVVVNALVYANGTTDYFETYVWTNAGGTNLGGGANLTYFSAHLVQQA